MLSPDREFELSIDDRSFRAAPASHGDPFLPRLVSNAVHRYPIVPCFDVFNFEFLSGVAKRTISAYLATSDSLHSISHGHWRRAHGDEHPRGVGSADRKP